MARKTLFLPIFLCFRHFLRKVSPPPASNAPPCARSPTSPHARPSGTKQPAARRVSPSWKTRRHTRKGAFGRLFASFSVFHSFTHVSFNILSFAFSLLTFLVNFGHSACSGIPFLVQSLTTLVQIPISWVRLGLSVYLRRGLKLPPPARIVALRRGHLLRIAQAKIGKIWWTCAPRPKGKKGDVDPPKMPFALDDTSSPFGTVLRSTLWVLPFLVASRVFYFFPLGSK